MQIIKATDAIEAIRKRLKPKRFQHCLNVAQVAQDMAGYFEVNPDKAYLTGLLHDYAKNLSPSDLLELSAKHNIGDETEIEVPELLHGPVGAFLIQSELGIDDPEILQAIRVHTLGSINMSSLDKIIFLADMIEPQRDMYPDLDILRVLCYQDLDQSMLVGLASCIRYCLERRLILHPRSAEVWNKFLIK